MSLQSIVHKCFLLTSSSIAHMLNIQAKSTLVGCRRCSQQTHRFFSDKPFSPKINNISSTAEKPSPVVGHVRPPRKLRQVSATTEEETGQSNTTDSTTDSTADSTTDSTAERRKPTRVIRRQNDQWSIVSYSTAVEYKLEALKKHLQGWNNILGESRYHLADAFLTDELMENAVHYKLSRESAKLDEEQGDVFIFSEGSAVFWNVPDKDANSLLGVLEQFEVKPYPRSIVKHEAEYLHYSYMNRPESPDYYSENEGRKHPTSQLAKLTSSGQILLDSSARNEPQFSLIKYAFSDAIAMSVKLAVFESLLLQYVSSIENVAEDMKTRGRVALTQDQVLRKTGELFDLRHAVNLGSNMLDPPDFYWDREDLEKNYRIMCSYLNISRRTKVINEKLNHCYALVEFFRDHLNNEESDRHHAKSVRLELWIIALISVEVILGLKKLWKQPFKNHVLPLHEHGMENGTQS